MSFNTSNSVRELKIQASLLHKEIKHLFTGKPVSAEQINNLANRFKASPLWKNHSIEEISKKLPQIQLKHCLNILAIEQGFSNWSDLLAARKRNLLEKQANKRLLETKLYRYGLNEASIKAWFANYEEAKQHLDTKGKNHYLLIYKQHYFICRADHIAELGLDPKDPDWGKIGWDWAQPKDITARDRLNTKLLKLAKTQTEASED